MASNSFIKGLMSGLKLFVDFSLDLIGLFITIIVVSCFLIIIPILMIASFLWEVGQNLVSDPSTESTDNND